MGLFGYKNEAKEYKELESFYNNIKAINNSDAYIAKSDYMMYVKNTKKTYDDLALMEEKNVLLSWCKVNKVDYKLLRTFMYSFNKCNEIINKHNDEFIKKHLICDKNYLDNILKDDDSNIFLDDEQRSVVLSDEDYTLVIAGAGAGKTTTIEAKVKYLIEKKNIKPEDILIVSFTRKATNELKERFKRLKLSVEIATFHSIGNTIIKNNELEKHNIVSQGFMFDTIHDYLITKLDDEDFIKKILLFFASYLNIPFDETNTTLLFNNLKIDNNTTLKSDLTNALDEYQKQQTKLKRTLNDERVRSIDECRIANFLFINDIDYKYESVYKYCIKGSIKPYCHDFVIKQFDKEIYLEHFGISENGTNNRFSSEELKLYKQHVRDKIKLHREHGTKLIYTFSKYNDGRDLITHLKEELIKAGISLNTKTNIEIYKKIAENVNDKYFNKLIMLICNFINKFKVNNYSLSKFDEWKITLKDERTKIFVDICYKCFLAYSKEMKEKKCIDFEDMINNASNILDDKIKSGEKLDYKYILIDEYQDISMQRFDLAEKLSQCSNAKIVAVGDDWQSIFRFSGAKLDLFTKFEEKMGYANVLKITHTYRNSQELIDIAGGFIMQNDNQIQKKLLSSKHLKDPIILMSYNDTYKHKDDLKDKGPYYRLGEAIVESLDDIVLKQGIDQKVLIIGRYNFDAKNLGRLTDFFVYAGEKIVCKKYPKLRIHCLTAHASKGLTYDNTIIINGKDDILGFPSKIEDDPVMKLVIKDDEKMDYSEERRLFYVALTRTKNRVYIITPQFKPSKFILEIKDHFKNVILNGEPLKPIENEDARLKCPYCGYPLQKRINKNFKFKNEHTKLWICSNDPEICGFITNDLKGGKMSICKCPECEDGFLIVKAIKNEHNLDTGRRMLGCTNYKKDGTGCMAKMMPEQFTTNLEEAKIVLYNEKINLNNMYWLNFKLVDIVSNVIEIFKFANKIQNFNISTYIIYDVIIGNLSKPVEVFRFNTLPFFGFINSKYNKDVWKLIFAMLDCGIIEIINQERNYISLISENLKKEDYFHLYSILMEKKKK